MNERGKNNQSTFLEFNARVNKFQEKLKFEEKEWERPELIPGSPWWLLANRATRFDPRPGKGTLLIPDPDKEKI